MTSVTSGNTSIASVCCADDRFDLCCVWGVWTWKQHRPSLSSTCTPLRQTHFLAFDLRTFKNQCSSLVFKLSPSRIWSLVRVLCSETDKVEKEAWYWKESVGFRFWIKYCAVHVNLNIGLSEVRVSWLWWYPPLIQAHRRHTQVDLWSRGQPSPGSQDCKWRLCFLEKFGLWGWEYGLVEEHLPRTQSRTLPKGKKVTL